MASALCLLLCLSPLSPSLPPLSPRLSLSLSAASQLLWALCFTRGFKTRLQHRTCKTSRGVLRFILLRHTRLQHRTCKTSWGHFASLVRLGALGLCAHGLSTERARLAGGTSLRSWFQKKCLLPVGIFIFSSKIPPILKVEVVFFSDKKSFSQIGQIFEDLFFIN